MTFTVTDRVRVVSVSPYATLGFLRGLVGTVTLVESGDAWVQTRYTVTFDEVPRNWQGHPCATLRMIFFKACELEPETPSAP